MKFDVTEIPAGSKGVRLLTPGVDYHWDTGVVVTELEEGRTLYLQMGYGKFDREVWEQAQAQYFPAATKLEYERWSTKNKKFELKHIMLR